MKPGEVEILVFSSRRRTALQSAWQPREDLPLWVSESRYYSRDYPRGSPSGRYSVIHAPTGAAVASGYASLRDAADYILGVTPDEFVVLEDRANEQKHRWFLQQLDD